jgi:hypothetical protein
MPTFQRVPGKFAYGGMDVHHPPDSLPDGRCSLMFNLQPDLLNNALTTRPPIALLNTTVASAPVHSIVRLNDSVPEAAQPFARFVGAGFSLYAGQTSPLPAVDAGFSGNPLAMVPYRPTQAAEPWLYVYDSMRQQRYKTDGTKQNIGIAAPTTPAEAVRIQPLYNILEEAVSVSSWFTGGAAGGTVAGPVLVPRVIPGTTAGVVLYDTGTTGIACIAPLNSPAIYPWMTAGSRVQIDSEYVTIEQIFPGGYSTSVLAIQYDVGSTGLCTIVPAIPLPGLSRNMLIQLNVNTYVRVLSVTAGPDASYSFRCSTGATTITAGQTIIAIPSFRAWTTVNHTATAPLTANSINFTFTPTVAGGMMEDNFTTNPNINPPQNISLVGNRPLQNEDYLHLSLAFDHPEWVTELHMILDLGDLGLEDYFYYVLRPGDFQPSITGLGTVTTQQATLQSQLDALSSQISSAGVAAGIGENIPQPPYPAPEVISTSPPTTAQLELGSKAWTEVMIKLSDLTRVGSNSSLNLSNVTALGFYIFVNGGPVNIYFGGWWAGGGYGPDCNFNSYGNQNPEIQWRYNYRNSLTGAHSTVSPETRNGEIIRRQGMNLTAANSPDPQVDMIEWERRGGSNPDWHFILQVPQNGGPGGTTTALDNITENAAQAGDPLEVTSYQPWPVTDVPKSGVALVVGTQVVWQSGDKFNLRWLRGTEIIIGGNTYSLYAPPISTTVLQLAQSVVPPPGQYPFTIPEATIEGQPIYAAWLDEANNRILGCGDPLNPGFLYFSNNDNPDGASDSGYIEVTSPSEPLLNGFYMEGANYAFTSSSVYRVESTPGAANPYVSYRLSGVEGMAGPWAFDAQRKIVFYFGPDGIYGYAFGPSADNLTAQDLFPLFPHEGQPGRPTIPGLPISIGGQTIFPPNYAVPNRLRIGYSESFVYATYQNSNGDVENLKFSLGTKGWAKESYKPEATLFALEKGIPNPALLVGGVDGNLYEVSTGEADAGGTIDWVCLTPARDAGDSRAVKQFGDLMLDYSGCFNIQVLWDNLLVNGVAATVPPFTQRTHYLQDLFTPPDTNDTPLIHYNMACLLTGVGCPVFLYEWQPSYLPLPEITTSRVTDWQTGGALHYKFVQGIRIHANTFGVNKTFQVQYDGYQLGPVVTINHQGEQTRPYSFGPLGDPINGPFKCHMMRLVPLDDVPWDLFPDSEWIAEPEPEPANYWISQPTALGQNGFLHSREIWFPYAIPGAGAVISAIVDGGTPVTLATLGASPGPSKVYLPTPPLKGKYWQLTASGTGLQIYENDLEFLVKSWGSTGPYARVKPFGDVSGGAGASGARI